MKDLLSENFIFPSGGSLESGASSSVLYDPTELIRAQSQAGRKFIVVSGNYRLNLFGFMACPDLASEDPNGLAGNYGMILLFFSLTQDEKQPF